VEELAARLATRGHQVQVYCISRYTEKTTYRGVKLIRLPAVKQKHLEMISYSLLAVLHLFFSAPVDVVHFQSAEATALALPLRLRTTVVATSHGPAYRRTEKWGKLARALMKVLELGFVVFPHSRIVIAEFLQRFYQDQYGCQVTFIPNGVTVRQIEGEETLTHFGLELGRYILYVGRLVASKGCHVLVDAYKQVQSKSPSKDKLVVVGDTTSADNYVESLLEERSEDILFTGYLSGDELWQLYKHCAIFVFPSVVESLPMALLEAMSFGIPVLYADVEENRLVAQEYAYRFKPNDADDLADRLIYILAHPEEANRLASRAKQHTLDKYDWETIVGETEQVYAAAGTRAKQVIGRLGRYG
jgi:glycosyltransferase involved in cell wall biosynthesis